MWFVTSQKNGVTALGLQRELGFGSYETAWTWLHKLRRAFYFDDVSVAHIINATIGAIVLLIVMRVVSGRGGRGWGEAERGSQVRLSDAWRPKTQEIGPFV